MQSTKKGIRVPYALAVYDDREISAVNRVLESHKTMLGDCTKEFEKKIAGLFGKEYGVMVNSGSSANLLAFELLNLPKGSEVVTPILTFATTVAPIIQKGLVPSFVDVEIGTYIPDAKEIRDSVTKKTKCLMIPSLIGNVPDLAAIQKIASDNGLYFVEDSCDTLGSKFDGKPTGEYSHISTTSFYGSHVITTAGGGGMICFNDANWLKRCRMLSSWGRTSAIDETEDIQKRFSVEVDGIKYDSKFLFEEIGYNFMPLEIAAAFGLEQLNKLSSFIKKRHYNFAQLEEFFTKYKEFFILPQHLENVENNWLTFPLTIKHDAPFSRIELMTHLETNNIQTRPIFTGNLLRQPCFKNINHNSFRKNFPNADFIMKNSFLIGCHQGLEQEQIEYMKNIFSEFLNRF